MGGCATQLWLAFDGLSSTECVWEVQLVCGRHQMHVAVFVQASDLMTQAKRLTFTGTVRAQDQKRLLCGF